MLTDPPYGINLSPQRESSKFKNTKVLNDDNLEFLPKLVNQLYRISKNVVLVFCGWQKIDEFKHEFEKKFTIKNILVWDKMWFGIGNNYRPQYELCLLCCKDGNIKTKSNNKGNVLRFTRMSPQKMIHSCEKPIELLIDLINELSNENDTVLDCFMGSGSTGIACIATNRKFIGIELDNNYFEMAKERIEKSKESIFDI